MTIHNTTKQADLPAMDGPGVQRVSIPEVDALAEAYIKERDKRSEMTPKEASAKEALIEALHKHAEIIGRNPANGEIRYVYDDTVVILKPGKEALKVKGAEDQE